MSIYTGTVRYATSPDPFPGKYGNSYNIAVTPHDPNAPNQDEDGLIRVYKTEGTPECAYIRRLDVGDEVTLILQKKRKGEGFYYQVSVPAGTPVEQPKPVTRQVQAQAQASKPSSSVTVHPLTSDEMDSYRVVAENLSWQYKYSLSLVKEATTDMNLTDYELSNLAMSLMRASRGWWRTDMKVDDGEPDDEDAFQELWTNMDGNDASAWKDAASIWLDETGENIIGAVKALNISSGDYLPNKAWELVNIVSDYLSMLDSGASESVAKSAVADRYGIKLPADPLF